MTADSSSPFLGERLARWLDDLGLTPHLAEAGLPTFVRDDEGLPRWSDPRTGLRLDDDQLTQLDRLLHQEGSEPEHAVPVPLLLIARQARVRQELLDTPWLTYETLGALRGTSVNATRFAVHKAQDAHRLLVVATETGTVVPAFQLTDSGEPRPDLQPVLAPLLAAGMDPWRAWAWLTQPVGLLGGQVPERLAADPDEADLVRHAAVRLAERVADPG
ncbi:hypothetical protein [Nocardioides lijunqiniae]|uniref:hypothetical protein n=1 Tax=Nocardioides lijunqiniae TaxID=2760832 RepID=UPI001878FD4B|nr:hypothetical protein [Nocardioides lijunqiniae]